MRGQGLADRVEDGGAHRRGRVDDGEHRRRHQVAEARLLGRLGVVVDRVVLVDRLRVLADAVGLDLEGRGLVGLSDVVGGDRHGGPEDYATS